MAKLNGVLSNLKGSIGNVTFVRIGGQTVAKERIGKKSSSTTYSEGQLRQQVLWGHLGKVYKAFDGKLRLSFENKRTGLSNYNEFMSANVSLVPVYLTKAAVRSGGCVVAGYQISRGTLPTIAHSLGTGGKPVTDIALGSLTVGSTTTLKQFSEAVIAHNDAFGHGDQLSCFVITQHVNAETQVPYITVKAHEVTLDIHAADTLLSAVIPLEVVASVSGVLGTTLTINGAIAWVHSRMVNGALKVSTQHLMVQNSILAQYQSHEAYSAALLSYGGPKAEAFLAPNADSGDSGDSGDGADNTDSGDNVDNTDTGDTGDNTDQTNPSGGNTTPPASGDIVITAQAQPAAGGTVSGGGSYASGASVTLTAVPNSGYKFLRWNDGDTNAERTVTATESKTYNAIFTTV